MGFVPVAPPGTLIEGDVDYRLARTAALNDFRKGTLSKQDICDAHPELRRAAAHYSRGIREECPICEDHDLVLVSYVFGPRLPSGGRCVRTATEISRFSKRSGVFTCYVVEVCPACAWNHLRRAYVL